MDQIEGYEPSAPSFKGENRDAVSRYRQEDADSRVSMAVRVRVWSTVMYPARQIK
jgi:hypothetical protein